MHSNLMLLPASDTGNIRLVKIPEDFEEHEVYRYVTGLIAAAEEKTGYNWEEIADLLEQRGFETVDFVLGPSLD